ncbi:hypothetical protein N177_2056 [Lutibaculum baratangense AMV1]|uniref:Uncharacterized protein n=1 Tax=Lutibaculum baratangense AMV1 TaxID=631454 RepID=V4QZ81_9HYPH|nr:hypothetical protein N177_2056 [Lutibaculum baratangense AMV1]
MIVEGPIYRIRGVMMQTYLSLVREEGLKIQQRTLCELF